MNLANEICEACRLGAPTVQPEEAQQLLSELPGWSIEVVDEPRSEGEAGQIPQLQKQYRFRDFAQALRFTQALGELAEAANHHPAILTEWGRVTVCWWTHKIKGLHRNDFVMAAKTDQLFLTSSEG